MNSQPFGSIVKPNNYNKLLTSPDSRASDEVLTIVDDNIYDPVCTGGRPNHPPPPRPLGRNGNVVHNENVEKVLNRENKLNDLDSRAQELHSGAKVFVNQAGKLKRKVWWRNFKMWVILGIVILTIIFIIIISAVTA